MLRTLAVRHSGAGQPSLRSRKRMVAKEKKKRIVLLMAVISVRTEVMLTHCLYMILKDWKAVSLAII